MYRLFFPIDAKWLKLLIMELHGTIVSNLEAAVASAARLRGHSVYRETIIFWTDLLDQARRKRERGAGSDDNRLEELIARLEMELADRSGGQA